MSRKYICTNGKVSKNSIKTNSGLFLTSADWIDVNEESPLITDLYEVKFNGYSDDVGRYNRGFLGLPWLSYWSDEKYGLREVTHWRVINQE